MPVEIWHLKAAGKANWGKMPQIVARIDAARAAGVDISANTYAYTAWFNTFSAFVPPWAHDGGDAKLDGAAEGSGDAGAHSQGHDDRPERIRRARTGTTSGRRFRDPRRF